MRVSDSEIVAYLTSHDKLRGEISLQVIKMKRSQVKELHKYKVFQQKDGRWRTYVYKDGKRKAIVKRTEDEVYDSLSDFYSELNYSLTQAFEDYEEHRRALGNSANTEHRDRNDWSKLCGSDPEGFANLPVRELTYEKFDAWIIRTLRRYKGQKGRRGSAFSYRAFSQGLHMIRRVLMECYRHGKVDRNPRDIFDMIDLHEYKRLFTESHHRTEAVRFLDEVQLHKLRAELKKKHAERPDYLPSYAVDIALGSGCRAGEIAALRWDHIDLERGVALIDSSVKHVAGKEYDGETKTGKIREIALTADCITTLKTVRRIQAERHWESDWVFFDARGRISKGTLQTAAQNWMAECGCTATGLQVCRRTFNQMLTDKQIDITTRCAQLGHTAEVNGKYYSRSSVSLSKKREAVSTL